MQGVGESVVPGNGTQVSADELWRSPGDALSEKGAAENGVGGRSLQL